MKYKLSVKGIVVFESDVLGECSEYAYFNGLLNYSIK